MYENLSGSGEEVSSRFCLFKSGVTRAYFLPLQDVRYAYA
jgi:hypothetical protein